MHQLISQEGRAQSQAALAQPICALKDRFDCSGALRTHQPLKLLNNLSLRSFLPEY